MAEKAGMKVQWKGFRLSKIEHFSSSNNFYCDCINDRKINIMKSGPYIYFPGSISSKKVNQSLCLSWHTLSIRATEPNFTNKKKPIGLKLRSLKTSFLATVQVWTENC